MKLIEIIKYLKLIPTILKITITFSYYLKLLRIFNNKKLFSSFWIYLNLFSLR